MYAVVTPSRPHRPRWVPWMAAVVSVIALIVAAVTAYVAKQQVDRVSSLEETVLQMQIHMEQILQFTHEYLEYEEDEDPQGGLYEELTVRGVVRKKRQASENDDGREDGVPIYDQAYGVDLSNRFNSDGLRLYESFVGNRGEGDPRSDKISFEVTESPIKPHHRVSNLWVPKKRRQRYHSASGPEISSRPYVSRENDGSDDYDDGAGVLVSSQASRRAPIVERRSRVKATAPNGGFSAGYSSVVRQTPAVLETPTVVEQRPGLLRGGGGGGSIADSLVSPYIRKDSKKKRPRKKQGRRSGRRRARSTITLAHFVAAPANRTAHHVSDGEVHDEWTPAAWMDKLGLNRKYALRRGSVTVKESGLYYLYAQVLYEPGRFGTGFQLMVDGIAVMECTLTPSQPSHSCHTSGTTYLQRNAEVYIRDLESHMTAVRREKNSFFGLIKLMDAPDTAEKLLLG